MEYKGYRYWEEEDREEDCIKIFHWVETPEGKTIHMDWSPYSNPSQKAFELWIDLGCPDRIGCGPLDMDDLLEIKRRIPKSVKYVKEKI
jgi:hypothetical protein